MSPSARIESGQAPRRAHFAVPVPSQSTNAPPTASTHTITSTVVIDGPDLAVAEQAVFVGVHEERHAARRTASDGSPVSIAAAFHRLGPVEPVEVQDRRRDVDHVHEAVRCVVVDRNRPGANPGARTATGVSDGRSSGGAGPTTMTASRSGSTSSSSRPTSVSVSRSARVAQASPPARRTRSVRRGRRARDRTPPRARPRRSRHAWRTRRAPRRGRGGGRTARRGRPGGDRGRPARPEPCPRGS